MFGHPSQNSHMMTGVERAIASPKTPAHLKPHLHKRLSGGPVSKPSQSYPQDETVSAFPMIQPRQPKGGMAKGTKPQPHVKAHAAPAKVAIGTASTPKPKPRKFSGLAGGINRDAFFGR